MVDHWIVIVGGQSYGPYSLRQMEDFIGEGRVIPQSLVGQPGSESMGYAGDDPMLGPLFGADNDFAAAEDTPDSSMRRMTSKKLGRLLHEDEPADAHANIVIIADIKSRSVHGMEEAIFHLGQAYPMLPQVWLLRTDKSVYTIRRLLTPYLGGRDLLFVVDTTHDTAAWANFGPEPDSRIRRMWAKPDETERQAG